MGCTDLLPLGNVARRRFVVLQVPVELNLATQTHISQHTSASVERRSKQTHVDESGLAADEVLDAGREVDRRLVLESVLRLQVVHIAHDLTEQTRSISHKGGINTRSTVNTARDGLTAHDVIRDTRCIRNDCAARRRQVQCERNDSARAGVRGRLTPRVPEGIHEDFAEHAYNNVGQQQEQQARGTITCI